MFGVTSTLPPAMNAHGNSCVVVCVPISLSPGDGASSLYVISTGPDIVASTRPVIVAPHVTRGCGLPNAASIHDGAQPEPSSSSSGCEPAIGLMSVPFTIG